MNNLSQVFCPAIIIMAKVPRVGFVKTRLQPFLSDEQTVSLAVCFLQDAISNANRITPNIIVAFTPPDGRKEVAALSSELNVFLIEQRGGDLGERIESAVEYAQSKNFNPIIVIGTDSPTLPVEYIQTAVESFQSGKTDVALGAAEDGGFYLIGLRKNHPGIFDNIAWSSTSVFEQTTQNVKQLGLQLRRLPEWFDVDTPADLFRLREEMLTDEKFQFRAPQTFQWLAAHSKLFDTLKVK
jgi:rSAM/selenodomain-associated transferase 1